MTLYVVTGANGFIGRHLVASLVADGLDVRALTRKHSATKEMIPGVEWIVGDTLERETWQRLVQKDCIVINLAFSNIKTGAAAVNAMAVIIEVCAQVQISHLIHCSTVSVYGRADEKILTEQSVCKPIDIYGRAKLHLDEVLIDKVKCRFPATIIRPTVVFGEGGDALVKLLDELTHGRRFTNYLKSSIFGQRKTHLVPVETVVAAFRFVCNMPAPPNIDIFIVSGDDDPVNNFRDVERLLMNELKLPPYKVPRIPIPRFLLEVIIRIKGRANVDTQTEFRSDKLAGRGFTEPVTLKSALRKSVENYKASSKSVL